MNRSAIEVSVTTQYRMAANYVISGSITFVIEGMDKELTFNAGDTYLLPSKILHNETWVSGDYQVLETYAPANAGTQQLTPEVE